MRLGELIEGLGVTVEGPGGFDARICDITEDSRTVMPGSLFIARAGAAHDGRRYIADAISSGASAILTDGTPAHTTHHGHTVAVARCADVLRVGAMIAERFYGSPSRTLKVVGVTGTNGKSTVAHMVHRFLNDSGTSRCGLVGTIEIDDGREVARASMTTPPATELSYLFRNMMDAGCGACAIEVSSHALHQGRADGVRFDAAVFTNLTGDHLDYHKSMEEYARCKAHLFELLTPDALAVVNADDPAHARMVARCTAPVMRTTITNAPAEARAAVLGVAAAGTLAVYEGPWGRVEARSPFIGAHNVSNALQAMVCAHRLGVRGAVLERALQRMTTPAGRLERVSEAGDAFLVLVDYAHSDDSLAHALAAVRPIAAREQGRVIVVFGCGGDRDRTKRPRMGRAASTGADVVFITSDNPRTEKPGAIIDEIRAGIDRAALDRCRVDADRRVAIGAAIGEARPGDVVLIAGKGHEDYQILPDGRGGTVRIDFDDRVEARAALAARRGAITEAKQDGGRRVSV